MSSLGLKLVGLLVKTIAKPIANRMKAEAPKHLYFSKISIEIGQGILSLKTLLDSINHLILIYDCIKVMHKFTSRINVLASGYKFVGVKPIPEETALKDGIEYIAEWSVFSVAGGIIIFEVLY